MLNKTKLKREGYFKLAKYSSLITAILIIPSFIWVLTQDKLKGILMNDLSYVVFFPLLMLILDIFIMLGFIQVGKIKKFFNFVYLLIFLIFFGMWTFISPILQDILITFPESVITVNLFVYDFLAIVVSIYLIKLSHFYRILRKIGILGIISSVLSISISIITGLSIEGNLLIAIYSIIGMIGVQILNTIINIMQFTFFSKLLAMKKP